MQQHDFGVVGHFTITLLQTRMWANANVMATMPNIAGALCSMPQSLADAHQSAEH